MNSGASRQTDCAWDWDFRDWSSPLTAEWFFARYVSNDKSTGSLPRFAKAPELEMPPPAEASEPDVVANPLPVPALESRGAAEARVGSSLASRGPAKSDAATVASVVADAAS